MIGGVDTLRADCLNGLVPREKTIQQTIMTKKLLAATCVTFLTAIHAHSQMIMFFGQIQSADATANDWVLGSTMWGSIDTSSSTATSFVGFDSLDGLDPAKLTWTFGDLELTNFLEPTVGAAGFEVYTENDASIGLLEFFYDGVKWAEGTVDSLRVDVENSNDANAVGSGTATLTSAGADDAFYNEVVAISGGILTFELDAFDPVDANGLFNTSGTISAVPEPETYALVSGLALIAFAYFRRTGSRRKVGSV